MNLTCAVCCCSELSSPRPPAVGSYAGHACVAVVTRPTTVRPIVRSLCAVPPPAAGPDQQTGLVSSSSRQSKFDLKTVSVLILIKPLFRTV